MLVVTTDDLPGYEIREVLGEVIGVTARTNNPFNEGIRSLHGGTNPKMMESLIRWREEAVERMAQEALKRGANAVVGMRFDHRDLTSAWIEICAYGTAAVVAAVARRGRSRRSHSRELAGLPGHGGAPERAGLPAAAALPAGAPAASDTGTIPPGPAVTGPAAGSREAAPAEGPAPEGGSPRHSAG